MALLANLIESEFRLQQLWVLIHPLTPPTLTGYKESQDVCMLNVPQQKKNDTKNNDNQTGEKNHKLLQRKVDNAEYYGDAGNSSGRVNESLLAPGIQP